jgi:PAS domain S-box-containing protein
MKAKDRLNILILNQDKADLDSLKKALESASHQVKEVYSFNDAQEWHRVEEVDVVLLDADSFTEEEFNHCADAFTRIKPVAVVPLCSVAILESEKKYYCPGDYGCIIKESHPFVVLQTIRTAFKLFLTDQKAREALNQKYANENLFVHVCESMKAGILVLDNDFRYTYWNSAMAELTGKEKEEVIGRHLSEEFPEIQTEVMEAKQKALRGQPVFDLEAEFLYPDGSLGIASHNFMPLRDQHREIYGILGVVRDVTTRRHFEQDLIKSEKRYRELVDTSINGVVVHNESHILFANKAAVKLLGGETEGDITGQEVRRFIHPDYVEAAMQRIQKLMENQEVPFVEEQLLRLDGTPFYAEVTGAVVHFNDQKAIQVIFHDVTQKKRAEESLVKMVQRLSESESLLSSINKNLLEGLYRSTKDDKLIYVNEGFVRMFGYNSVEECLQMKPTDFYADASIRDGLLDNLHAGGKQEDDEVLLKRKDGTTFWGLVSSSVVYNSDGSVRYYDGAIHDISDIKAHEDSLQTSLKEKEILLAEIHHRVKNNLAVISGLIDLQRHTLEDENMKSILLDSQNRILSIAKVHELLYGSENFADISIQQLLEQLCEGISGSYNSKKLDINFHIDAGNISMNATQAIPFGLLLNELINNTYKHAYSECEKGNIHIRLFEADQRWYLSYSDDGAGLPKDFDARKVAESSLGFSLIYNLSHQLEAENIEVEGEGGFSFDMDFKPEDKPINTEVSSL